MNHESRAVNSNPDSHDNKKSSIMCSYPTSRSREKKKKKKFWNEIISVAVRKFKWVHLILILLPNFGYVLVNFQGKNFS